MHEFNSYEEEGLKDSHFQFKRKNETYKLPYPKRYKAVKITGSGSNHEFIEKIKVYSIDYPNEALAIAGLDEIKVNNKVYTDLKNLLEELNKILYKKGGGEVSGNTGIQQTIYDLNSFNWNVHPDINVKNFYAIKTGKLVTIKAYIEIIQAQDMGRISLLTLPEELRGKSEDTAEYSQVILVDGYVPVGVPITTTFRELKYNVTDGYIDLKADSDYDNFNDCNFSFTISYLSDK